MKAAFAVATIVAALLGTSCYGTSALHAPVDQSDRPADGLTTISVRTTDFAFAVEGVAPREGENQFRVENAGTQVHEFVLVPVEGNHYGMPLLETGPLEVGQTRYIRGRVPAGTYRIVCLQVSTVDDVPSSHLALGMSAGLGVMP